MKKLNLKKIKILNKLSHFREKYVFTDNRHPEKGIMSTILGVLSDVSLVAVVLFSYRNGGQAFMRYAAAAFVAAIFSCLGLALGIMSRMEKDIFKLFPNLGIILNLIAVLFIIFILVLGFM